MKTGTRTKALANAIPLGTARLRLLILGLVQIVVPAVAALAAAWVVEPQLAAAGFARVACLVLAVVLALSAVDSLVTTATEGAYRRAYGRVHGPRSWSCEDCAREIRAHEWTPWEAAAFEAHLSDPRAHNCDRQR